MERGEETLIFHVEEQNREPTFNSLMPAKQINRRTSRSVNKTNVRTNDSIILCILYNHIPTVRSFAPRQRY